MARRNNIEEQINVSEERFRVQYQHNPIPTFTWQKTGDTYILKYYNEAAVKLTGGDIKKFINKTANQIYKNRPDIIEDIERCYSEKVVMRKEIVSENFDPPKIFIVTWSFAPPDLVITYMEDITRRKHDEEERQRWQQNLQQAQKMESIGRLAGGIAHDFNNMLTVIMGYTELIKAKLTKGDPLLDDISEIEKAAVQSRDITRQLLAFSRQEITTLEIIDLNELVENVQKSLLSLIGEDIDLKFFPGDNLWKIKIDPSQMQQVLINFSINARDAMPQGGKLTLETENVHFNEDYCRVYPEFTPGDYVLLGVSDDGVGIDKEIMSNIFEPFFTTKEKGKGTGLGLATVYGIVKQNRGFINIYSEPGYGTTFKIYIPRCTDECIKADAAEENRPIHDTGSILLVEDNEMVRKMTADMLEVIGYTVVVATSASDAISLFDNPGFNVDLVITDVVMPEMNGKEMGKKMKTLRPGTRILFMSGYTTNVIVHRGVLDDNVHFIQKPFSMHDLADKIKNVLNSQ